MIKSGEYSKRNYFLKNFFNIINDQKIDYCVIHGYEALPLDYFGHDLDILINYYDLDKIKKIIFNLIKEFKLNIFRIEERQQLFEFVLFDEELETIILQFIFMLDYRGIPIFENKEVFSESRKFNSINIPSMFHEYTYSFFVRYFWGKEIHQKYFSNFKKIYNNADVKIKMKELFSKECFNIFSKAIIENNEKKLLNIRKKLIKSFFLKGIKKYPHLFIKGLYRRYYLGISNAIKHKGKFIVFIGPDGVGKTKLAFLLMDILKDFYRGIKYFHFMPNKLIDRKELKYYYQNKKISLNNNSNSKFFSIIRLIRNTIRFNLYYYKIIFYKNKQNLIIGDRYFYNYLFYPSSMKYFASQNIAYFFYRLIPKPNFIFCIEASPEIIISRKKELSHDQIVEQLELLKIFSKNNNNAFLIENNDSPQSAVLKIAKILVKG